MRKLLISIVLLSAVMLFITHKAEVEAVLETLQRGNWGVLALALLAQGLWFFSVAATYRAIFRTLGTEEGIVRLALLAAASTFLNVVTPSGGMSGMAVFITDARRRGRSVIQATLAGVLYVLFDYAAFICVLTVGLVVLFRRNNLTGAEILASLILVGAAGTLTFLLYLGMRSEQALGSALARMAHTINGAIRPFLKRNYLSEERGYTFARDAAEGLQNLQDQFREHPKMLLWPFALALSNKALLMTVFFLMFIAFQVPFSAGTIVAGFSIATLFVIVSPTPAGIGVVEGLLTVTLRSLNISLGSAAVLTLAYRGFTFWLPLLMGMGALRVVGREQEVRPSIKKPGMSQTARDHLLLADHADSSAHRDHTDS